MLYGSRMYIHTIHTQYDDVCMCDLNMAYNFVNLILHVWNQQSCVIGNFKNTNWVLNKSQNQNKVKNVVCFNLYTHTHTHTSVNTLIILKGIV